MTDGESIGAVSGFLLLASGTVLENGNSFFSAQEYKADHIIPGHFQEIHADYDTEPRDWRGWQNFDGNCEMYVFGYGSLVSPESIELTLQHGIDRATFEYAQLRGWKRSWNVGSDKESHPERTFRLADGSEYEGVTVVLGIEPAAPTDRCDGSVFSVTRQDLTLLDVRERNYERVEVTDRISWAGKPDNCVVYTYKPSDTAIARIAEAKSSHRPINVRKGYKELVEEAFADIGKLDSYRRTTPDVPYKVQAMESIVDPDLLPAALRRLKPAESVPRTRTAADDTGPVDEVSAQEDV